MKSARLKGEEMKSARLKGEEMKSARLKGEEMKLLLGAFSVELFYRPGLPRAGPGGRKRLRG